MADKIKNQIVIDQVDFERYFNEVSFDGIGVENVYSGKAKATITVSGDYEVISNLVKNLYDNQKKRGEK